MIKVGFDALSFCYLHMMLTTEYFVWPSHKHITKAHTVTTTTAHKAKEKGGLHCDCGGEGKFTKYTHTLALCVP